MTVLAVSTPTGGVLGAVAPLGLLAAGGPTALLVDVDPDGPRYPGSGTLADMVEDGPTAKDLSPVRKGAAVLGNGGIALTDALEVVKALIAGWPQVVLRLPPTVSEVRPLASTPVVSVHPLLDVDLFAIPQGSIVYQRMSRTAHKRFPGVVLPVPNATCWPSLLAGTFPAADRWVRAWRVVWRAQWA